MSLADKGLPLEVSAKDFGVRLAKTLKANASSTAWFFIQQAYSDYSKLDDLEWSEVSEMLDMIIAEEGKPEVK